MSMLWEEDDDHCSFTTADLTTVERCLWVVMSFMTFGSLQSVIIAPSAFDLGLLLLYSIVLYLMVCNLSMRRSLHWSTYWLITLLVYGAFSSMLSILSANLICALISGVEESLDLCVVQVFVEMPSSKFSCEVQWHLLRTHEIKEYNEATKLADDISGVISELSTLHACPDTQRHVSAIRRKITILGTRLDSLQSLPSKLPGKQHISEKEMNHRNDMIGNLRSKVKQMASTLTSNSSNRDSLLGPEINKADGSNIDVQLFQLFNFCFQI